LIKTFDNTADRAALHAQYWRAQDGSPGFGDQPLTAHDSAGAAAYFHADRLGSVRALTDAVGTVTSARAWEPYGRLRAELSWLRQSERSLS
jgi:hypothetical protein